MQTIPYYEANPKDILNSIIKRMTNFGSLKFWNSGIVIFGAAADATMGGNSDGDVEVKSIFDLREKDTKVLFEVLDVIGKDGDEHIENKEEL